jgi:hypothetical protein
MARPEITGQKLITFKELCHRWGDVSHMFVERLLQSDPHMPKPVKFPNGRVRFFYLDQIEAYELNKIKSA